MTFETIDAMLDYVEARIDHALNEGRYRTRRMLQQQGATKAEIDAEMECLEIGSHARCARHVARATARVHKAALKCDAAVPAFTPSSMVLHFSNCFSQFWAGSPNPLPRHREDRGRLRHRQAQ
jgi:hypothetical protein